MLTTHKTQFLSAALTAALILLLSVASTVKLECCVMSTDYTKPFKNYMDALIADQMRRGLTTAGVLNINAMDALDPVHYRARQNPEREFDYDGDMGREHDDYMRDNGAGLPLSGGSGIAPWRQIGDSLPVIEAPSIVTEQPHQPEQSSGDRTDDSAAKTPS